MSQMAYSIDYAPARAAADGTLAADAPLAELLSDQLVNLRGVCFALRGLHDSADNCPGYLLVSCAVLFDDVRVCGQGFVDGRLDGTVIAYNFQASGGDDIVDVAFPGQHSVDGLTRKLGG